MAERPARNSERRAAVAAPDMMSRAGGGAEGRAHVLLLHGLWRSPRSMRALARAARAGGYAVHNWAYASRTGTIEDLIDDVGARCRRAFTDERPVHAITHSLGGIIARGVYGQDYIARPGRLVMVAPPNHGAGLVGRMRGQAWLARIYGRPMLQLAPGSAFLAALAVPDVPFGVIAGTRRLHPCNPNSWVNALTGNAAASDGSVEVASARLTGMADFLTVDAPHTLICSDPRVVRQALRFLETGGFEHDGMPAR